MDKLAEALDIWGKILCKSIPVGGLWSRNKTVYKWKVPFRSMALRECAFWRIQDLLSQAHVLHKANHVLGSRILIRGAIETLAILIYLNQQTAEVLAGKLNFHQFSEKTSSLLLGSRDGTTNLEALNIKTILGHCNKRYPGIEDMYASLSESAHPNWEGICSGYSKVDHDDIETHFSNNWSEMWTERHEPLMLLVMRTFESEYNDVWAEQFDQLEKWIEENDADLEATKTGS